MAKIEMIGLNKLASNLELLAQIPKTAEAKAVFVKAAQPIRKWARYFAPYDKNRKKGTHLRDAILVSPGPKIFPDVLVVVRYKRPGAPHAHLLEFGTVKMAPHPFMRPAVSTGRGEVEQILHKDLLALIKSTPR